MCPTGDKYKYVSYGEISVNMCPIGDRNKNKSAISVRFK